MDHPEGDSSRRDFCSSLVQRDCSDLAAARMVLQSVQERWAEKMKNKMKTMEATLKEATSTDDVVVDWATLDAARRMLKANVGNVQKAIDMLESALEMRQRDRTLFSTLRCEARSDTRVMTRDLGGHPVVYFCSRSQQEPLRYMRDQFVVTFEAACKLTSEMGQVSFIVDTTGLRMSLNMDPSAIKDISDVLGTIYAERIFTVTVIDFSWAAQILWKMLKPLLSQKTQDKFFFVPATTAKEMFIKNYDEEAYDRISKTMEINRDPNKTLEELAAHARATSLVDVPLGPPMP